jgi:hypothetical protein
MDIVLSYDALEDVCEAVVVGSCRKARRIPQGRWNHRVRHWTMESYTLVDPSL